MGRIGIAVTITGCGDTNKRAAKCESGAAAPPPKKKKKKKKIIIIIIKRLNKTPELYIPNEMLCCNLYCNCNASSTELFNSVRF